MQLSISQGHKSDPSQINAHDLDRTCAALNETLNGLDRWQAEFRRCAFVEPDGHAVVIEATEATTQLRITFRHRIGDSLEDRAAWVVELDGNDVSGITDDNGNSVTRESAAALNDVLWLSHRLAVEDAVSVIRS